MEPVASAALVIDENGVVADLSGALDRFGLTRETIGRKWADAFPGWDMPPLPDLSGDSFPCRLGAATPGGQTVSVELFRLPARNGAAAAVLSDHSALPLSDRQQQLCALGEVSAGVAHEINNALTLLQGWLDLIRAELGEDGERRRIVELLLGETQRIGRLTSNLLQVARGSNEARTPLNLAELVGEVVNFVNYEMKNSDIRIEQRLATNLPPVAGSSGLLKQALLNLLVNARQAMPHGGKVVINADGASVGYVTLTIEDTGCGIPAEIRNRVFSPYFTTKKNGTGLGLSVTRKIVEEHGGSLDLAGESDVGTRFVLRLPALKKQP